MSEELARLRMRAYVVTLAGVGVGSVAILLGLVLAAPVLVAVGFGLWIGFRIVRWQVLRSLPTNPVAIGPSAYAFAGTVIGACGTGFAAWALRDSAFWFPLAILSTALAVTAALLLVWVVRQANRRPTVHVER
ncbi:hypothetical protein [Schumannella luteola]